MVLIVVPYLSIGVLVTSVLLGLVPLLIGLIKNDGFSTMIKRHSTISSFAADPKSPANRLLLLMTSLVGPSLVIIYSCEYEAHNTIVNTQTNILFALRVIVAFLFILVGVFYTRGNTNRHFFKLYEGSKIPIAISDVIHSAAALLFMVVTPVADLILNCQSALPASVFPVIAADIVALALLVIFLGLQVLLRLWRRSSFLLDFTVTEKGITRLPSQHEEFLAWLNTYAARVGHALSFLTEMGAFLAIVICAVLGTMIRLYVAEGLVV
jgi:hypothetical protein